MFNSNIYDICKVRRSRKSYEDEIASYKDMLDEIQIKDKIYVKTPVQIIRYNKYISLLKEFISIYD